MNRFVQTWGCRASYSFAIIALAALAAPAFGEVRGSVRVMGAPDAGAAASGPRAFYWEEWNGFLAPATRRVDLARDVAVVLLGSGEPVGTPAVELSGGSLMPSTLVARPGTVLSIENRDDFPHELFGVGLDGMAPETTSPEQRRSIRVPAHNGHFVIRDRIVTHLRAHIHIVPNLIAVGRLEANGNYLFPDLPGGTYTLKVFLGDREASSQEITVADGRDLTVDPIAIRAAAAAAAAAPSQAPAR